MNHYYSKNNNNLASKEHNIQFKIHDKTFHFITDNGVFSKSGLDFGSRLLIENAIEIKRQDVLDLGCGYAPIGIVYKQYNNDATVTMSDVNLRAIDLASKNSSANNLDIQIIESDGFEEISQYFDLIITNPPVRTGKQKVYQLFQDSYGHLNDSGTLVFVMNKKQGAMSALHFCEAIYKNVEVIAKKSGFCVIQCIK